MATLARLYDERDALYREIADVIVDTGSQSLSSLAHRLEHRLAQLTAATHSASGKDILKTCAP
jgi:shikimate kinase